MGLMNNLRNSIVQKLIRPEDGYVYVGTGTDNKPIKFYYNMFEDKYILNMSTRDREYFIPTLTGWADGWAYSCDIEEIDFKQWISGVLDSVYKEYSERLDNISTRELKNIQYYKKEEGTERPMITKKSFCSIMEALKNYWDGISSLEKVLNTYFEENMLTEIFDSVIDVLEEELEPEFYDPDIDFNIDRDPLIMRWMFELDCGKHENAAVGIDGHPLTTAEELYDYLVWKREKNISETP